MKRFETELNYIVDPEIRKAGEMCVLHIPEYFYEIPASSTGKYHPEYALGEGGLYRHTKAAVRIAKDLLDLEQYGFTQYEKDCAILALILHDSRKSGDDHGMFTKFEHPLLASNAVRKDLPPAIAETVCSLIESHMGQWNTSNRSSYVLPKPVTALQMVVHLADYLASRKYLLLKFDENNEVV